MYLHKKPSFGTVLFVAQYPASQVEVGAGVFTACPDTNVAAPSSAARIEFFNMERSFLTAFLPPAKQLFPGKGSQINEVRPKV